MFDLNTHSQDSIYSCIAYCGMVDRLLYKFSAAIAPQEKALAINAGVTDMRNNENRNAMIAKGTLEWLREFHKEPIAFSLSNTYIKSMHKKIFKYSHRDDGIRGHYRTDLDKEMRELFQTTKSDLDAEIKHPLFVISLFRVSFMKTMPFVSGNKLCSNLLSYALLFNNGYAFVSKLPLLPSLNDTYSDIGQDAIEFLPKTIFNLLDKSIPFGNNSSNIYLNPRRTSVLKYINDHAPVKISDILSFIPNENRNTIKKDLLFLRDRNLIIAHGEGRGMFYAPNEKI